MSAWTLVPCLVALRDEFNQLSPRRDKGADGSIGDSAHTSRSDHTPDEDSDVLRDHDGDSKNEVHALDIDSSGPWPESFDAIIRRLVARERAEYESATVVGRLQNVIWNRQIASRSWGWAWHPHTGSDPHTNHAHFSARYTAAQESDTRPWGVFAPPAPPKEIDVAFADEKIKVSRTAGAELFSPAKPEGTDVTAATLLQLAAIHAARAARATEALKASAAAEAQRDASTAAALAGMQAALAGIVTARGALTGEQLQALTDQVRQAAAAAGAQATAVVEAKLDSLRQHLGDTADA